MTNIETVLPSQVLEAIQHAKKSDPKDPDGINAFRLNIDNLRKTDKGLVRYIPFEVLRKSANGKWEYIPLNLRFMNLVSRSKILPPNHPKKKFAGACIQFRGSSTFNVKTVPGDQLYGQAKVAIYRALAKLVTRALKDKKIFHNATQIRSAVQTERIVDANTGKTEKLSDPIIRVTIPFKSQEGQESNANNKIALDEKPKCRIYDVTKPNKEKGAELPYMEATYVDPKTKEPQPITYGNIGDFITPGSSCTGVDCMDTVALSQQGISLPSKVTLLLVKPGKGFRPDARSVFGTELDGLEDAAPAPSETPDEDEDDTKKTEDANSDDDLTSGVKVDNFENVQNDLDDE